MKFIEAIINDASRKAREKRSTLNLRTVNKEIANYLATGAAKNWAGRFNDPMKKLMSRRIKDLTATFRKSAKQTEADLLRQAWFNEYLITFAQPIFITTEEQIRRLIEQAVEEGTGIATTQKRLRDLFNVWLTGDVPDGMADWFLERLPERRVEMIARTETIKALNTVSYRLYDSWGVDEHEWLATMDKRTRPDHKSVDGQVVKMGTPFDVGGAKMLYPGDPNGPVEQVANCRCTTIPKV